MGSVNGGLDSLRAPPLSPPFPFDGVASASMRAAAPRTASTAARYRSSVVQLVQLSHLRRQRDAQQVQRDPPAGVRAAEAREETAVRVEAGGVGNGEQEDETGDEQKPGRPLDEVPQVESELVRDVGDHAVKQDRRERCGEEEAGSPEGPRPAAAAAILP